MSKQFIAFLMLISLIGVTYAQEYVVGDMVKFDMRIFGGEYTAQIYTPQGSYIQKSDAPFLTFETTSSGEYIIYAKSGKIKKEFFFKVRDSKMPEFLPTDKSSLEGPHYEYSNLEEFNQTFLKENVEEQKEERGFENFREDEIVVGRPVKWKKQLSLQGRGASLKIPELAENISINGYGKKIDFKIKKTLGDTLSNVFDAEKEKSLIIGGEAGDIEVIYETPAPEKKERKISEKEKELTVSSELHYENVTVMSSLKDIKIPASSANIKVYWVEEKKYIDFEVLDIEEDGRIDELRFKAPHLSTQTFKIIIEVIEAEHLDAHKNFIEDIYYEVGALDNVWSPSIKDGEYVRVTFEENLTNQRDISLYPRIISGNPSIEVYEKGGSEVIATFSSLKDEEINKVYLSALEGEQDVFDLKIVGGEVSFDYITDPFSFPGGTYHLAAQIVREQNNQATQNLFPDSPDGAYPATCGSSGDRLSCDDGIVETATSTRVTGGGGFNGYGGVNISTSNSTIQDCLSINQVFICYEFWGSSSQHTCTVGVDANGGASWTDSLVTCSASAPGVTCTNVTASETWTCNSFFGLSGTRALAKAQAQKTGGSGQQTWNFDVLYFNVSYTQQPLSVFLNSPLGNAISGPTTLFNFTPSLSSGSYTGCSLWHNATGTWHLNQTNTTTISNGVVNTISKTFGPSVVALWNIECCSAGSCVFAPTNRTVTIDTTPPLWSNVSTNVSSANPNSAVLFWANWTDTLNLSSWEFFWDVGSGFVPAGNGPMTGTINTSSIAKILPASMEGKDIFYYFRGTNLAGLQNQSAGTNFVKVNDITAPVINSQSVSPTIIDYGKNVTLQANVTDNIKVDKVLVQISLPNSSIFNYSINNISTTIWQINYTSFVPGRYNATIFANDTSGLTTSGALLSWNMTGYSQVNITSPLSGSFSSGSLLLLRCEVNNANTTSAINSYPVTFYTGGVLLGTNYTNSSGIAIFNWTVQGNGLTDINCTIANNQTLFYNTTINMSSSSITILSPQIDAISFSHENLALHSLNEYGIGDTISWVNVTVNNTGGANSNSVNVSLGLLYPNGTLVSWFIQESRDCGALSIGQTCAVEFNNAGAGFALLGTTQGTYKFNASVNWTGGGNSPSHNQSEIIIHYIIQNISGALSNKDVGPGTNTTYDFNISNPWSQNLSYVNVSINCPNILGLNCSWNAGGSTYVNGDIIPSFFLDGSFNITTNSSTPVGGYTLNMSIAYINPGDELKTFNQINSDILNVRPLLAVIYASPSNVTRGTNNFFSAYSENIGPSSLSNVNNTWIVPFGWQNTTGLLYNETLSLGAGEKFWANVTILVNSSSELGTQQIDLIANSPDAAQNIDSTEVEVYANTSLSLIEVNNTSPFRGETILITTRLIMDNGTALSNRNITFQNNRYAQTNETGYANLTYVIPNAAPAGDNLFIVNASFLGNTSLYVLKSYNQTNISVQDFITITPGNSPLKIGYGENETINATVTSTNNISFVYANITGPSGITYFVNMNLVSGSLYNVNFSRVWESGVYNVTIWANNSEGFTNETTTILNFTARANATINIQTNNTFYIFNQIVNLTILEDEKIVPPTAVQKRLTAQIARKQNSWPTQNQFPNATQGTYPATCGSSGDRLSCDDGITESATSDRSGGTNYYGGVNITSYDSSIADCVNINEVILYYEFWGTDSQHTCTVGVDANGGANWTDTSVTCSASAPGIAALNVTLQENWQCSSFFGQNGTRALAKAQAVKTGAGGSQLWDFDVLYFNVTYTDTGSDNQKRNSIINNTGITNINVYYLMTLENNNTGNWTFVSTILNDTNTSILRNIPSLTLKNLSTLWNAAGGWSTTSGVGGGVYRAKVSAIDSSGNILKDDEGNNITSYSYFEIDSSPPQVNLTFPPNQSVQIGSFTSLNYTATDPSGVANCSLFHNQSGLFTLEQTKNHTADVNNTFVLSGFTQNTYIRWNVRCFDNAGNTGFTSTDRFFEQIIPPDFTVNNTEIVLMNTSKIIEGENTTINATIWNIGGQANTVNVSFYKNYPNATGIFLGSSLTFVDVGKTNYSYVFWNAEIGPHNIFVVLDPPLETNGTIAELNESNNLANNTFHIASWQEFYGNASITLLLALSGLENITAWGNDTVLDGNVFITDQESDIEWLEVYGVGRNDTGAASSNDFFEIDTLIGSSFFQDSISSLYTTSQTPKDVQNFIVSGRSVSSVPIINSTNTSYFVTGILWDNSDDSNGEFDLAEAEDIIFVSRFNRQKQGGFGIYDYEITIPVSIRSYNATEQTSIYLYHELN